MASGALEKSALEAKDREQLTAIASALGVKSASRAKKSELIDMILEQTKPAAPTPVAAKPASRVAAKTAAPAAAQAALGADGEPLADWEIELSELPLDITEPELYELLENWGHVTKIKVMLYTESSTAYIDFSYKEEAEYFVEAIHKTPFDSYIINAELYVDRR